MRNQQNLYPKAPTAVAKLLQYSGLGSNSGMGFLRTNDSQMIETSEFQFGFGMLLKTVGVGGLKPRMKISVLTDISVLGFYGYIGYIGDISMDIFT